MEYEKLKICNINQLFKDYCCYLTVVKAYAKGTIKIYCNNLDEFIYFLYKNNYEHINQISNETLLNYILYVKKSSPVSLSNSSINIKIAALNNFFQYLSKNFKLFKLLTCRQLKCISKIPNVKDPSDVINTFRITDPVYKKNASWVEYRDFAIGIFLYSSGARISEAMSLKTIDIDTEWVRLETTKNKEVRYVPLNIHVNIAINNYKEQCPYSLFKSLWVCKKGRQLKSIAATSGIKRMFKNSPHYFRHAFATHLILNGCDLRVLQELLGHKNIATTSIYTHVKPKYLKNTVNRCHPLSFVDISLE